MAKHKAPTQVTIAPLAEKSPFEEAVGRYWKPAALVCVAIAAAIVFRELSRERERTDSDNSWNDLASGVDLSTLTIGSDLPAPEDLAPVVQQLAGTSAGPWAQALEAQSLVEAGQFDRAKAGLDTLQAAYPDHVLVKATQRQKEGDDFAVVDRMRARATAMASQGPAWLAADAPPELPEDAPRVKLVTARGPIVVGLYSDRAPLHVENFLKLCREGYYDGTRLHRVIKDQIVQGGDPNSRDEDAGATWGLGGPDYTIPAEITNAWHFPGMLAAAKKGGDVDSSGSQFYLTASATHQFDKQYTVFGRIVEGLELVEQLVQEVPDQSDRPENPVVLEGTVVL